MLDFISKVAEAIYPVTSIMIFFAILLGLGKIYEIFKELMSKPVRVIVAILLIVFGVLWFEGQQIEFDKQYEKGYQDAREEYRYEDLR